MRFRNTKGSVKIYFKNGTYISYTKSIIESCICYGLGDKVEVRS